MKTTIKATWENTLKKGEGSFSSENTLMDGMNYHFTKRPNKAATTPEEFLAAAYSACYNMTLAMVLSENNHTPKCLETHCHIDYDMDNIKAAEIEITATIDNLEEEEFLELAAQAKKLCPIGNSFAFPSTLTVNYKK
ncbi:MAG: OsmC family peroxiredoxin [Mesonia hippocampi]|uniref:OsmC family peroxiredoxin n=1 Tax=Mesonia hippocampi TaxID=1628250 RepID=UPI003F992DF9